MYCILYIAAKLGFGSCQTLPNPSLSLAAAKRQTPPQGRVKPHPIWNMACATTSIYLAKNGSLLTSLSGWYGALSKPSGGSKSPISCPTADTFNHATSLPNKAYDRHHMQKEIYNINPSWFCSGVCLCVCLYLSHLGWSYFMLCRAVSFAFHWSASETNLM